MSQPSLDLDDGGEPTFSVAELAEVVNAALRRSFPDGIWVRGEVEGVQVRGGHTYFTLAERTDTGRATVSVALFAGTAARLRPALAKARLRLADGLRVRLHGRLDLYAPTGRLTFVVDGLDPRYTLGELASDRDRLLQRLAAEGLLDRNGRLALPAAPLRIGLVTSRDSAAWHDVTDELARSGIGFRVRHCDVRVQGAGAPAQIAAGIATLGRSGLVDVVLVVRGGGARSDLAVFDTDVVALAIATCPVPVLTGLGHEIDRSVADEVAHTALKTPTACAAHLLELVRRRHAAMEAAWVEVLRRADGRLVLAEDRLVAVGHRLAGRPGVAVQRADARVAAAAAQLGRLSRGRVEVAGAAVDAAANRLAVAGPRLTRSAERHLDSLATHLRALDPARVLARGWSIARTVDGRLIRSPHDVAPGDRLVTLVSGGTITSRVEETDPEEDT